MCLYTGVCACAAVSISGFTEIFACTCVSAPEHMRVSSSVHILHVYIQYMHELVLTDVFM